MQIRDITGLLSTYTSMYNRSQVSNTFTVLPKLRAPTPQQISCQSMANDLKEAQCLLLGLTLEYPTYPTALGLGLELGLGLGLWISG